MRKDSRLPSSQVRVVLGDAPSDEVDCICRQYWYGLVLILTSALSIRRGSVQFRHLIESYSERYKQAEDKYSKMALTREIYFRVSQNSRFLRFNEKEEEWEELSPAVARDKVRNGDERRNEGKNLAYYS